MFFHVVSVHAQNELFFNFLIYCRNKKFCNVDNSYFSSFCPTFPNNVVVVVVVVVLSATWTNWAAAKNFYLVSMKQK